MWVFDGEEWTQDNGSESTVKPTETTRPRYEEMMPELQVVEIVVPLPKPMPVVPPLPLP